MPELVLLFAVTACILPVVWLVIALCAIASQDTPKRREPQ